jgi:adenosylcobinamide-phosphate synthase
VRGDSDFGLRLAGALAVALTVGLSGLAAWLVLRAAALGGPLARDLAGALLIYFTLAARSLADHSGAVRAALDAGDLPEARRRVGWIVGRDTAALDAAGVARAAVESVAESTVDGVTAPLLFALACGPVGAVVYRAINTLDSMWGYRNERYAQFGWAAAKLDDLANWLPARLTAPAIVLAAALLHGRGRAAARILRRDGRRHLSPNSGLAEAAFAGALGVQLGGTNLYGGRPVAKPTIGEPERPLAPGQIAAANRLMFASAGLVLAAGLAVRLALGGGL